MATSLSTPQTAPAQGQKSADGVRRIDVHHHILPPEYVAVMGERPIGAPAPNREMPKWKISDSLEAMDRQGIATAIVSVSTPGVLLKDPKQTRRLARICNDFAAGMVAESPMRFGTFSCLPLPDVPAALDEIKYVFDTLNADGIGMMTNYADRHLGDPAFVPVFDELDRRHAVVYVHPTACTCDLGVLPELPASFIELPHESTRAICSLMFSGTFSRCPNIRFIFSHAGGTVPFLARRIAILTALDRELARRLPEGVAATLKRLFYDTASSSNPIAFGALFNLVTPKNVLLGTDFPFVPEPGIKATLAGIREAGLDETDIRAIEGENAASLFARIGSTEARTIK